MVTEAAAGRRDGRSRALVVVQILSLMLVAALLGLLVWKVARDSTGAGLVAAVERGDRPRAPEFDLAVIWDKRGTWPIGARPALADGRVSLAELRGTPVVLNFWASWCIPCKEEAPYLAAAARAYRDDVAFLGLDIQDFTQDARRFLERLDVPYPSVRDSGNDSYSAYGLTGVPETYYIDGQGRIVAHATGAVSREELERGLLRLLASTSP
jgi:cytochrome c biogenesis protein CcmG/thiol:disulfide interchange protein DsbE